MRASVGREGYDEDGKDPSRGAALPLRQADEFDSPTSAASMPAPEDGVVFFESTADLVPEDTNGETVPEVFEYDNGEVYLISSFPDRTGRRLPEHAPARLGPVGRRRFLHGVQRTGA